MIMEFCIELFILMKHTKYSKLTAAVHVFEWYTIHRNIFVLNITTTLTKDSVFLVKISHNCDNSSSISIEY